MSKMRVGIIFGGRSAEHEVSLQSAKNIVDALDRSRFEPVLIGIDKQGHWHLNDPSNFLLNQEGHIVYVPHVLSSNSDRETVEGVIDALLARSAVPRPNTTDEQR